MKELRWGRDKTKRGRAVASISRTSLASFLLKILSYTLMTQLRGGKSIKIMYNLDYRKAYLKKLNNNCDNGYSFPTVWSCSLSVVYLLSKGLGKQGLSFFWPACLTLICSVPFHSLPYMGSFQFPALFSLFPANHIGLDCCNYNRSVIFITWFFFPNLYSCVRVNKLISSFIKLEIFGYTEFSD